MISYLLLLIAIAIEVVGTSLLKASDGATRLWPTLFGLSTYVIAFLLLAWTVQRVAVSVAYAMWSGLGTATIVVIGATVLGEPITATKVIGVSLIVAGVVVLNVGGAH